jgi:hypothetical protein
MDLTTCLALLGSLSALRIGVGLLGDLWDLIQAYILPRIWTIDFVKTYGRSFSVYL